MRKIPNESGSQKRNAPRSLPVITFDQVHRLKVVS